jgi:hypothetical protein
MSLPALRTLLHRNKLIDRPSDMGATCNRCLLPPVDRPTVAVALAAIIVLSAGCQHAEAAKPTPTAAPPTVKVIRYCSS